MTSVDLRPILAGLSPAVVSEEQVAHLQGTLNRFPQAALGVFGLECRLGDEAQVDLGLGMNQGVFSSLPFGELGMHSPEWGRIAALAERSTRDGSALRGALAHIWLEFDDAGARCPTGALPAPAFVVSVHGFRESCLVEAEREALIREVLVPLAGEALEQGSDELVRRCFLELPPEPACVADVGVFLSRDAAIRVCVANLRDEQILPYLARLGWQGDAGALARILGLSRAGRAAHPRPGFLLHLDVAGALRPSIGLEFLLDRHIQLAGAIAETELLELLVAEGACLPRKSAALQRWPGHELVSPGDGAERLQLRRVNSVKLSCGADQALRAKAYLVVVNRSGLR